MKKRNSEPEPDPPKWTDEGQTDECVEQNLIVCDDEHAPESDPPSWTEEDRK